MSIIATQMVRANLGVLGTTSRLTRIGNWLKTASPKQVSDWTRTKGEDGAALIAQAARRVLTSPKLEAWQLRTVQRNLLHARSAIDSVRKAEIEKYNQLSMGWKVLYGIFSIFSALAGLLAKQKKDPLDDLENVIGRVAPLVKSKEETLSVEEVHEKVKAFFPDLTPEKIADIRGKREEFIGLDGKPGTASSFSDLPSMFIGNGRMLIRGQSKTEKRTKEEEHEASKAIKLGQTVEARGQAKGKREYLMDPFTGKIYICFISKESEDSRNESKIIAELQKGGYRDMPEIFMNEFIDGQHYLAMEYCSEGDVQSYLRKHKDTMSWDEKMLLSLGMINAMRELHEQGIAHIDPKLANFVIVRDAQGKIAPKLIDFGTSQSLEGLADRDQLISADTGVLSNGLCEIFGLEVGGTRPKDRNTLEYVFFNMADFGNSMSLDDAFSSLMQIYLRHRQE